MGILQGYFEVPFPEHSLRVRIMDGKKAVITQKLGSGLTRMETEMPVSMRVARLLMQSCLHSIEKDRYFFDDEWTLDFYHGPLEGLMIIELEMDSADKEVSVPKWVLSSTEVTNSISNLHLARLETDLKGFSVEPLSQVYQMLTKRMPKIVLTGGPCSGKSSVMETLSKEMSGLVHCVPEVATIVISRLGVKPENADPVSVFRFNRAVYRIQKIFEATSAEYAISMGRKAMILDRGSIDNAAYMPGGIKEMEETYKTTVGFEYSQYDAVVCLETPAQDVYEAMRSNNPARTEDYAEACSLGSNMVNVWKGHPDFYLIKNGNSWQEKERAAVNLVKRLISQ